MHLKPKHSQSISEPSPVLSKQVVRPVPRDVLQGRRQHAMSAAMMSRIAFLAASFIEVNPNSTRHTLPFSMDLELEFMWHTCCEQRERHGGQGGGRSWGTQRHADSPARSPMSIHHCSSFLRPQCFPVNKPFPSTQRHSQSGSAACHTCCTCLQRGGRSAGCM